MGHVNKKGWSLEFIGVGGQSGGGSGKLERLESRNIHIYPVTLYMVALINVLKVASPTSQPLTYCHS